MLSRYTNVTHSVKPITSGYRLVLIYNLVMGGYCAIPSNPVRQNPGYEFNVGVLSN